MHVCSLSHVVVPCEYGISIKVIQSREVDLYNGVDLLSSYFQVRLAQTQQCLCCLNQVMWHQVQDQYVHMIKKKAHAHFLNKKGW